ncbi:nitrogen fixation protein NifH [Candidatus Bathyarchaeota archaeon]|nr:nitrogen fixation protein NifH [Candidatus Bathyarchaeota archaeon]
MNIRSLLRGYPTEWLLEENNPSVRYFTLRDILNYSEKDKELIIMKKEIPKDKRILKIFNKQKLEGYWEDPNRPYLPKYKSTYWQIMILSQLGLEKSDERVSKACEFIFQFQLDEGGFSSYEKPWSKEKIRENEMSCLTGNVIASLIRLGYIEDKRVWNALKWLIEIQNIDGGWLCPYWKAHIKDKHGCFMGTITPLDAFSEVPSERRTPEMLSAINRGVEFLLMHKLYKADHHDYRIINNNWLKLGFPTFFYDILRGLTVVTKLGFNKDERLKDALEVLLSKQDNEGRWILESTPIGRMHTTLESKGKPSKWITLNALKVIKNIQLNKETFLENIVKLEN